MCLICADGNNTIFIDTHFAYGFIFLLDAIVPAVQLAVPRRWGHGVSEPDDVFDARWEAYFNR